MNKYLVVLTFLCVGIMSQDVYDADGNPYGKVQNVQRQPVMVIDTVHFDGDSLGTLVLNPLPSQTKANVSGDAWLLAATQQDVSTARSEINTYVLHKQRGDTLTILSSDADDTATVVVMLWVL